MSENNTTHTSRRGLLKSVGMGAVIAADPLRSSRPNILMVLSDDHGVPHLGCYGDQVVQTPNLDRFAAEGMRFNSAYTTAPQCSPSRASIFTGYSPQRVHMTRLHALLPSEYRTFFEVLREHGYYTGVAGRTHHMDGLLGHRPWFAETYKRHGLQTMKNRVDLLHTGTQDEGLVQFGAFLDKKPKAAPFVFQLNFSDPHGPWDATDFEKRYHPDSIRVPEFMLDTPEIRESFVKYYAEISRADELFGRIMRLLDGRGLRENTMVVFIGDNGTPLPFGKVTLYQYGWHVPLLIRWPGHVKPGSSNSELISGVDFFATFLEAAGAGVPKGTESHSFLNLLEGKPYQGREFVFAACGWHDTFDMARAVCSKTHSLIFNAWPEYRGPRIPAGYNVEREVAAGRLNPKTAAKWSRKSRPLYEMFDLRTDPHELDNIAGKAEYKDAEFTLKSAMSEWMEVSHDFLPPPFLNSQRLDADPLRQGPELRRQ